jgi:DNA modification methylase
MINSIINANCYDILPTIKSKSIDLIITDPPYNISKESNFSKGLIPRFNTITHDFGEWDKDELALDFLFSEYKRILKNGGTLITFYDAWKANELREVADKYKLKQPRVCQWVKNNPVPINSSNNYLSNAVEFFYTFVKKGKPTFNSNYDNGIYNYTICHGKERTEHPTQKPLSLIKALIEKHSNKGDLILDPFAGSGTIGVACKKLNRNYILIEKEEIYYNISQERIKH